VVGLNTAVMAPEPEPDTLRVSPTLEAEQVARLQAFRRHRAAAPAREALDAVQQAASGEENLMPRILHAVESRCTLGEIADALRAVFGEYRERVVI
jgi:methylmalonyl-CoA mutase N-terminal domain/subunit